MSRGRLSMVDYDAFSRRHIGPSEDQAQTMLMELGYSSMADFIADVVPQKHSSQGTVRKGLQVLHVRDRSHRCVLRCSC